MASVSGLTGLDTASIVDQLMQVEATSQNILKQRVSTETSSLSSLQTVNSKFASLAAKTAELVKLSNWSPVKASSSSDQVTIKAVATATTTSLSLTVNAVAKPSVLTSTGAMLLTDQLATATAAVTFKAADGTVTAVPSSDGTLNGIVTAINSAPDSPAAASLLKIGTDATGQDQYRLILTSKATGAASDFTLQADGTEIFGTTSGTATEVAGQDAKITVGADTITSKTNTFTGLMPGVDVTLSATAVTDAMVAANSSLKNTTASLTVSQDSGGMADSVKAMVDAMNAALADVTSLTAYKTDTSAAGRLAGDTTLRQLKDQLLSAVSGGVGGASLATYGIQLDRSGTIVFDSSKFADAYAKDPVGVAAKFTGDNGFVTKIDKIATGASDSKTGSISNAITSKNTTIDRLNDSIDDWDLRLELRRTSLTRQFTALETAVNAMNQQGSWLASQISSLPSWNS